jgi:hypothetical protein
MWAWPNSGPTYYAIVNQNWLDNIKAKGFAENRVEIQLWAYMSGYFAAESAVR